MSATPQPLTPTAVREARSLICEHIHQTPVLTSRTLSHLATPAGGPRITLHLKCENLQKMGAFKIRGATHALARLSDAELRRGVVTHSSGNHAQALALAASTLAKRKGFEIPAHVVMPSVSTPSKIAATRGYGAEVTFSGSTAREREEVVRLVQERTGAVLVPPYDHPDIIVGQGTVALELMEQVKPELLDAVVTPCGGGGLLAGVATACTGTGVRVYGAEPREGADDCARGLKEGRRIEAVKTGTVADGLRTPVGVANWGVISDPEKVKRVYTVSEEEIKDAMRLVVERCKILIEPSSAVPVAVVLSSQEWREEVMRVFAGREEIHVGIVISGGNTTIDKVVEVFGKKAE
ncbi:tryptophan synthase beta subunit-like PLP-dependent enzyme [Sphaerosporella brunnea]|uniref:Tryptophan synthase beta subunit-like PLP-dependent enzyme n=1 Tax=Sphaerosporella brunnea TaxID=1250544 RepID=A0A5J5EUZ0_9PEZI|nr:tryptophan synthase beta subunit-like PLP-dependent enzyme [Sphaerosporella brunnea]